ncbi:hypothetical protein GCM10011375_39980 [Hymenobacter qilianensis]|uniref:Uncharacterized protein n=2 Tax=Hymenobacter qilianensis TaxID=1385715 RepID=A0ACB5PXB8_9BACT|nr:PAS domain-containing protein [Hymenobacter qilianensis]QNP54381.1 PAS domain-containing protein [Hymenobacter qilianensis]GGF80978.1 hypothetical protein GCM10011375_39980 [Hymenobacter qilianensis]
MPVALDVGLLFHALPTPYMLLSPALVIEAASDAYLRATLTKRERLVGQYLFDAFPDNPLSPEAQSVHNLRASLTQVLVTGQPHEMAPQHYDVPDPERPGKFVERHWHPLNTPLLDPQGRVLYILHSARDVTAEVQAQVHLRASHAADQHARAEAERQAAERLTFYRVFEQTPALVALLRDPGHRFEYVNPAYQALFPGRQLVGLDLAVAVPELQDQGFGDLLDRVYQTSETYFGQEMPFTAQPPPGQPPRRAYYNFTYQAYRENGQVAGISIFAYDVTEQVLARQERAAQQRQLQDVFEQAPVAIFVVRGEEYIFDVVNPSMGQMLGSTPDQILGQRYFDLLPALADQGYRDLLAQIWHSGQEYVAHEQAAQLPHHRDGEPGYYNFSYVPLRNAEGRTTSIMCVAVDVTAQVRARQQVQDLNEELAAINEELQVTNEELNQSNTQLTRTNVDLDTFVYTASHDLKAPITNIESIVLALRETLPAAVQHDEMVAHLLALLDKTIARFQVTITQLTDMTRLQLAHTGPVEPVVLAQVVEDVRLDLTPLLLAAQTQLTVDLTPELVVSFAPANLRSVVYNLLSNAIKYRAPDRPSVVLVRAAQTPNGVVLAVQDNGLGMSEVQQRQLFGLFQRLHTHVEGTGVGLYISKRLVENAGGTISVQSQPHQGTTFTVTFPA